MKTLSLQKPSKPEREKTVLLTLIDLFLKDGKPIGSNTLKDKGFKNLSSATIRNYFAKLEKEGYLTQQHSSGGRIPTSKAYQLYVQTYLGQAVLEKGDEDILRKTLQKETKEIFSYLHSAAEAISEITGCPVFLSMPKLEMDFIQSIKFLSLDDKRLLCILITDFGLIRTETIFTSAHLSLEEAELLEDYFLWRLSKKEEKPQFKNGEMAKWAQRIYNEIMVRHVVGSSHSAADDIYRTGLSKLLLYPEFNEASALAGGLALLEDLAHMQSLLTICLKNNALTCWVGDDLSIFTPKSSECAVIAIPYRIGGINVGTIALIGPSRLPYRRLFGLTTLCSKIISETLTSSVFKYKINFKPAQERKSLSSSMILLENK